MSDDPLAGLLGSMRRQKGRQTSDIDFSRPEKPKGETGLNPLDLLGLPPAQRDMVNYLSRRKQATLGDLQKRLKKTAEDVRKVARELVAAGYVHEALVDGELYYRVVFGGKVSRSGRGVPQAIWDAVDLDNTIFLKQLPLFSHLSDDAVQKIALMMEARRYNRNEVIIWQGDVGEDIYFIKNGIIGISRLTPGSSQQDAEILAYLKQGDILAEHNLLQGHHYPAAATATALSEVELLRVNRQNMLEMMLGYDNTALEMARMLSQRLIGINTRLSSKGAEIKLSLIFGVGGCGTTTLGSALALTLAHVTERKAVYTEHPNPGSLPQTFDFETTDEIYTHPGGYDIAVIEGAAGLPPTVRTTVVMDRMLNDYANIVIGLSSQVDDTITYMLEKANQVVIVTSPDSESWAEATQLVAELKANIHPERTSLLMVVNRKSSDQMALPLAGNADFDIPFLSNLPPLNQLTEDKVPDSLKDTAQHLADRLGRTNQVGIYIPTTTDVDQVVDTSSYIQETKAFLGKIFGGAVATSSEAQGVWNSEEIGLVSETIHIVRTYVTQTELDRYLGDVLEYVEGLKGKLKQEAMALEVNQKLLLI